MVKDSDIPSLSRFISKVHPIINSINTNNHQYKLALDRYDEAVLSSKDLDKRVTYAISALEAILLKSNESELKHKLAQRSSILLKCVGKNPLKIYNEISKAYKIRSKYIHGEHSKPNNNFVYSILDYTRIIVRISIQLIDIIEKNKLVNLLDSALLDSKSFVRVKKLIDQKTL